MGNLSEIKSILSYLIYIYIYTPGLGSSTVDQVLKYIKYPNIYQVQVLVKYSFI